MATFMFFYHFAWMIIVLSFLPLVPMLRSRRFIERAGLSLPEDRIERGSIWIHALSVGEVLSAIPLVRSLNKKYPKKGIVFTVTTLQGMEIARKELERDVTALLTMPLDFWWSMRRIVHFIRPSCFILIETDVWPGLISYLRNRGIKTILVNGRISPRTFASYKKFRYLTRFMLNLIDFF
ncbi:MAG: glycosyltransferase N-terminal domain-containing protein, partial [Thermodesulfobacteriota bacterium]|nr:glycosyltransferase N-terminal domain-containing protein [Thermodesulfobacteriota bacterium]